MTSARLMTVSGIVAVAIIVGFALSIPHARDGSNPAAASVAATTTPVVTYHDSYHRGIHTITGSVTAPDSCTTVTATTSPVTAGSSTTAIKLTLSMPRDNGVCLQLPSPIAFSAAAMAPQNVPVIVTVNGALASTSTSTGP